MTLTRPWAIDAAFPNAADQRKQLSSIYPREGVFPDPITVAAAGIAYAGAGWAISARAFTAALKRGGAPFSQAYGTALTSNDGVVAAAWTISPAPASGSRIDRLCVRARDTTQGDSATGAPMDGPGGVQRAGLPEFMVVTGTAGTPGVAPALPAGYEEIAQVTNPAGAVSAAGTTIIQTYGFANVQGGPVYVRTIAERDALVNPCEGEVAFVLDVDQYYARLDGAWVYMGGDLDVAPAPSMSAGWTWGSGSKIVKAGDLVTVHALLTRSGGIVGAQDVFTLPAGFRPSDAMAVVGGLVTGGAQGIVGVTVLATGVVSIIYLTTTASVAMRLDFSFRI